jgi:hypothetical protein
MSIALFYFLTTRACIPLRGAALEFTEITEIFFRTFSAGLGELLR